MVDGLNIFVVERNCNDEYDIDIIQKNKKIKNKDLSIILMKEGNWYVPLYSLTKDRKRTGIYSSDNVIIKKMIDEIENN